MKKVLVRHKVARFFLASVLVALCGLLAAPLPVAAQQDIVVGKNTVELVFPLSMTFKLEASGPADIVRVILQYRMLRPSLVPMVSERKPDFIPQREVQASWTWDMKKAPLPPGATLEYWWQVEDSAGGRLATQPFIVHFDDPRFSWKEVRDGGLSIFWYEGNESFAGELLKAGVEARDKLSRELGYTLDQGKVYVYGSLGDLRGALVYAIGWEGGLAYSGYNTIILAIGPGGLSEGKKTVAHELTHLIVGEITFSPYGGLPTWLDEGLASYMEGQMPTWMSGILQANRAQGTILSVRSLSSPFPVDPMAAYLSYAESYSIVQFLVEKYGWARMGELLRAFKEGNEYDEALQKVYGFDLDGLNQRWQASAFGVPAGATQNTAPVIPTGGGAFPGATIPAGTTQNTSPATPTGGTVPGATIPAGATESTASGILVLVLAVAAAGAAILGAVALFVVWKGRKKGNQ